MFENYKIVKFLGKGSFGTNYLVESNANNILWNLEQIDLRNLSNDEKKAKLNEAYALGDLAHPNIISFHEAYITSQNKLCIITEFFSEGNLRQKIQEQNEVLFTEDQVIDWFIQICLGLKHIHDRKMFHKSLQSRNVFLSKSGVAKLGFFAREVDLNATLINLKSLFDAPCFIPPEIIENLPYSHKSDIWGLGVLLYELCCLKLPFGNDSLSSMSLKIIKGEYQPIPNNFSQPVRNLVNQLLRVDPDERPSIYQVLQEKFIRQKIRFFLAKSEKNSEFFRKVFSEFFIREASEIGIEKQKKKDFFKYIEKVKSESIEDSEEANTALMLFEMREIAFSNHEGPKGQKKVCMVEVPCNAGDEMEDSYEEKEKYRKILKFLKKKLGKTVFIQAINILDSAGSEENLDFELLYPRLKHLMNREQQLEFVPIICSLIEIIKR